MAINKTPPKFQYGDIVTFGNFANEKARITEVRGPLGPNGCHIYELRVLRKGPKVVTEMREDQLTLIRKASEQQTTSEQTD